MNERPVFEIPTSTMPQPVVRAASGRTGEAPRTGVDPAPP